MMRYSCLRKVPLIQVQQGHRGPGIAVHDVLYNYDKTTKQKVMHLVAYIAESKDDPSPHNRKFPQLLLIFLIPYSYSHSCPRLRLHPHPRERQCERQVASQEASAAAHNPHTSHHPRQYHTKLNVRRASCPSANDVVRHRLNRPNE